MRDGRVSISAFNSCGVDDGCGIGSGICGNMVYILMQEKMAHVSLTWDDFTRAAGPSGDQELLSFLLGGTDNAKGTSAPSLIFCNNAEDVFGPRSRKIGHRSLDQQNCCVERQPERAS